MAEPASEGTCARRRRAWWERVSRAVEPVRIAATRRKERKKR